jgi:hypothetical protein
MPPRRETFYEILKFPIAKRSSDGYNRDINGSSETREIKKRFAILLILVLAGAGCTYPPRSSEGTQISSAKIQELKIGQTTESDLRRLFGSPTKRERRADGTEV